MTTEADPVREGSRVLQIAGEREVALRALGGVAVMLRTGDVTGGLLGREPKDIDFATTRRARKAVSELLTSQGYDANREFNGLSGHRRLLFNDVKTGRQVDVFIDTFEMCHPVPLAPRLMLEPETVPLAELLLTKLQIVELNEKDVRDIVRLLTACDIGSDDGPAQIGAQRVAELCAADWGLYRTVQVNLNALEGDLVAGWLPETHTERLRRNVQELAAHIESTPKSRKWRARARVGDRVRWYSEPEEVT
jgi:hypothetical protein